MKAMYRTSPISPILLTRPARGPLVPSRLRWAIGASMLLHAAVLAVRFAAPEPARLPPVDMSLEVVLLNATDRSKPLAPDVLAQASMQGGGDRDQGRAKSPLVAEDKVVDGDTFSARSARTQSSDASNARLLAIVPRPDAVPDAQAPAEPGGEESADAADSQQSIARLQAQIARSIEDYNKRPRRLTFGVNAVSVPYARYVEAWAAKIERIGTQRYPEQARGKLYDSLIVLAEIDKHGNVVDVRVPQKSKHDALNRAAREIVLAGQPYDRFSPEMAAQGDTLQIVRTWTFTNGALETVAAK